MRRDHPDWWAAVTQTDVPAHQRTIRVWAAGNERQQFGNGAISEHHVKLFEFADFWGHELVVTALDRHGGSIAPYANFCGPTPAGWNPARHDRHFCLAAPGHALDGDPENVGTSPKQQRDATRKHRMTRRTVTKLGGTVMRPGPPSARRLGL